MFSKTVTFICNKPATVDEDGDVCVTIFHQPNRTLWERLFGRRDEKITLDSMGSAIWQMCKKGRTFSEMIQVLEREFPNEDHLAQRTVKFLEYLLHREMILPAPGAVAQDRVVKSD